MVSDKLLDISKSSGQKFTIFCIQLCQININLKIDISESSGQKLTVFLPSGMSKNNVMCLCVQLGCHAKKGILK